MRWPWIKQEPETQHNESDLQEAREARATAEHDLRKIRGNREEVERIANRLRDLRKRNHLVEAIEEQIKRRGHGAHDPS